MKRREFIERTILTASAVSFFPLLSNQSFAATGSDQGELKFIFYTDVHASPDPLIVSKIKESAEVINKSKVDFVIAGGDYINNGLVSDAAQIQSGWKSFGEMSSIIKCPNYPAVGNHDLDLINGNANWKILRQTFCKKFSIDSSYYSFKALGYHFIILDTIDLIDEPQGYRGFLNQEQQEWLLRELQGVSSQTPIVLVSHIPLMTPFPYLNPTTSFPPVSTRLVINSRQVLSLFEKKNLILVLQGHLHLNEMIKWRNTTFITGGAISGKWWTGAHLGTNNGFSIITLRHDSVRYDYVTLST